MEYIRKYGVRVLDENIKENRRYFQFGKEMELTLDNLSNLVKKDLSQYEMKVVKKENHKDFKMGWHQDDVSFFKNSKKHQDTYGTSKFTRFHQREPPIYTMILYNSTIGEDFQGGEFCFVDEEIKPKKGEGIFFDSREVHCVKKIIEGVRKCILIKFYRKDHKVE